MYVSAWVDRNISTKSVLYAAFPPPIRGAQRKSRVKRMRGDLTSSALRLPSMARFALSAAPSRLETPSAACQTLGTG